MDTSSSPDSFVNSGEYGYSFKSIMRKMRSSAADHIEPNNDHVIRSSRADIEANNDHAINNMEVNKDRLASMHQKISEPPRLLSLASGRSSCCIFRVPDSLVDVNRKAYQPHIVTIGPYHHGKPHLRMIEEHKWRYLGILLKRMKEKGLELEDLFKAIKPLEMKARECYSEVIQLDSDEFVEMMVLDGCFIIELFRKVGNLVPFEQDDPLISMLWILPFFYRDFLRLENQIPFFILQRLFDLSKMAGEKSNRSLSVLALEFFNNAMLRPNEVFVKYHNLKGVHLLDLIRLSFIPSDNNPNLFEVSTPTRMIHSVSKLLRAGIKLNPIKEDSFLVIKFKNGVIEMPPVAIDDFMSSFLLNCVAYEQCHSSRTKHFTDYATFLDCLVDTYKDVEYLCHNNIFENYVGTDAEVARFINDMGKDTAFDFNNCYLSKLFLVVQQHYQNSWYVQWESFKNTYFQTPWSFISALAALVLLLLTIAQTFYTIYSVHNRPK